jgi:hypothetical protein
MRAGVSCRMACLLLRNEPSGSSRAGFRWTNGVYLKMQELLSQIFARLSRDYVSRLGFDGESMLLIEQSTSYYR